MADYPALDIEFLAAASDPALRDRLYVLLDDFEPLAIQEFDTGERWRVFFQRPNRRDALAAAITSSIPAGLLYTTPVTVADEDWARRSQQSLRAVTAGKLVVAPPWDVPPGVPVIVIEPSTGFGTGHHATTRLCLLLLQRLELHGARVIDVGTGSGVLALAAWKLGASDIVAVDSDPDALDNARSNIERNGGGAAIDIIHDDLATLRIERGDVVAANLTGAVLLRHAEALLSLAHDGGYLILSGFAPADVAIIGTAFGRCSLIYEEQDGDWAAVCLRVTDRPKGTATHQSR